MADDKSAVADPTSVIEEGFKRLHARFDEERAKGEKASGEKLDALKREIDAKLEGFREEQEKQRSRFALAGSAEEKHRGETFSFSKAMLGIATQRWGHAPLEKEMFDQMAKRVEQGEFRQLHAMGTTPDTALGFLVPVEVMSSQLIPLLYAESVVTKLGATTLSNLTGVPTYIPRVSGGFTAYWVGEGVTVTDSNMGAQQVTLTPHTLAAMGVFSELLLKTGNPSVDAMARKDLAAQLALKLDLAAMNGNASTTSGEPTGILQATGVNTTTVSDPATYDQLMAMISEVRADNALKGKLGWAMSNADLLEIEQIKDVSSGGTNTSFQQLERRRVWNEDGSKLLTYPWAMSTQLSDGQIIFGNWEDLVVADWGPLALESSNAPNFAKIQINIRAHWFVDVGIRHAQSFCIPA